MYLCCSGVAVGSVVTLRFQPVPCLRPVGRKFGEISKVGHLFDRQKSDRPEFSNYTVLDDWSDYGRLVL
jgi:hypothetical protein